MMTDDERMQVTWDTAKKLLFHISREFDVDETVMVSALAVATGLFVRFGIETGRLTATASKPEALATLYALIGAAAVEEPLS